MLIVVVHVNPKPSLIDQIRIMSFLPFQPMVELGNPGVSGSIFYLTQDDKFIAKTVQHKEAGFLTKLLPGYYMNLKQVRTLNTLKAMR